MQFSAVFLAIAALASVAIATPAGVVANTQGVASSIVSDAEMANFLATTDAELTFIGEPFNPLAKRAAQDTTVTFCTKRVGNICGGTCTVYNGGATCLDAAGTVCMSATKDVGFCDETGCDGNCNAMSECGTQMGNGFCFVPNTQSILVSSL
ncbi:uncharacterized protein TRAVEDRAFT_47971 [Trametes versicolor FP-101664 SS1]|uniref:uncharacterized protein n=1 Tax=Trametes versicolor (strain FP-101664) TaxID=717944 RepID=UPI000462172C|nr:uncharacterized protein TRAVEDRAFT_47971 [Trametes versicolor FP-101664 SS1]EIW58828.1 hypothetical protein TRAVEDRAFT_47971 [Trametes versicolor FP-101664 SS1]